MEIGEKLSGRYLLTDTVGQGGMANVFLAHDLILDRDVAVKVLRYDFQDNKDAIRRFQREAMSASQLLHHNIVEVYDVDEEDNQQYIVMEFVKGTDLKTYIHQNAPISLELVVSVMSQILSGIDVAHKHRIIHRDIKPQNILITGQNEVKITDFGIAIALSDTSITQTNTLLGSVHYLSPEQARGSNATTKSDIYALGVVLYELITGSVPFDGESAVSIALKHFQEPFPRIRENLNYIPQSLENVVLKATAKEPKDRYNSVQEMLQDLSTSLSANRMNEAMFQPSDNLEETMVVKPIKPIPSANKALAEQATAPEPLDESVYPSYDEVAPISAPKRKRGFLGLIFVLIILLLLAGGGYYVYSQMMRYVNVPDVTEMTQSEAIEMLSEFDLNVSTVTQAWHNTVDAGDVISTKPGSNERVERNSDIELVMSNGKEQVEIGNYIGQMYEPIRSQLREANFIVERRDLASGPEDEGMILDQSIDPGSKVIPENTTITLIVGSYSESFTMQDFYNLSYDMVENFSAAYGVTVETEYEYSDFIPEGQIISQSPSNGTPLVPGDVIAVVVSAGPEEEEVVTTTQNVAIEYVPTYAEDDVEQLEPLPNTIEIYIGDSRNNINNLHTELSLDETKTIKILMYIPSNGTGQYRILRNGEVYAENLSVYPD